MVSDFRKKKLLHVFHTFFDTNKSGSIDKNDFDLAIEKVANLRGASSGDAKFKEIQESMLKIWEGLQKRGDADNDGQVSVDEWISMCDEYAKNPKAPVEWQSLYMKFIFQLEDASSDGSIDSSEFASVYVSFGLNKDEAVAAFQKMSNGKPSVSWNEFQDLWREYFTTEDPNAPGNFIFGKTSF